VQPSIGDTLVMDEKSGRGSRRGEIIGFHETLGARPYVMVVTWMDNGKVGLVFPGPDVDMQREDPVPQGHSCRQVSTPLPIGRHL